MFADQVYLTKYRLIKKYIMLYNKSEAYERTLDLPTKVGGWVDLINIATLVYRDEIAGKGVRSYRDLETAICMSLGEDVDGERDQRLEKDGLIVIFSWVQETEADPFSEPYLRVRVNSPIWLRSETTPAEDFPKEVITELLDLKNFRASLVALFELQRKTDSVMYSVPSERKSDIMLKPARVVFVFDADNKPEAAAFSLEIDMKKRGDVADGGVKKYNVDKKSLSVSEASEHSETLPAHV